MNYSCHSAEGEPLLRGKSAVITGCSRGIGRSTLEAFARNGADVWACMRMSSPETEDSLARLAEECSVRITPVYFDLLDNDALVSAMRSIVTSGKDVDILVNNAGVVSENALFTMTPIESMRKVFEVNFFSQMLITQYIVRAMLRRKRGSVVNVASIAALDGDPGQLEYVASKAALIGATKKLARELGPSGIRVNAVAPGITQTGMVDGMSSAVMSGTLGKSSLKRVADPAEIASAILYLASDLSSYVTGHVLRVDGGM